MKRIGCPERHLEQLVLVVGRGLAVDRGGGQLRLGGARLQRGVLGEVGHHEYAFECRRVVLEHRQVRRVEHAGKLVQ